MTELSAFIAGLPKAELHVHLVGSASVPTVLELARRRPSAGVPTCVTLPQSTQIRVWDSTAETRFIVLPMRPQGTDGWSEDKLAQLVTRDSMIGTGMPKRADEAA